MMRTQIRLSVGGIVVGAVLAATLLIGCTTTGTPGGDAFGLGLLGEETAGRPTSDGSEPLPPRSADSGDSDAGVGADVADGGIDSIGSAPDRPTTPPDDRPGDIQSGTLTAGSFDDNLNIDVYRDFVSELLQQDTGDALPDVSLGQRAIITVRNDAGEPVGDARVVVTVADGDAAQSQPLIDLTTGSDGRVLLLTGFDGGADATALDVTVHAPDGGSSVSASFTLDSLEWDVTLPGVAAALPAQLDLAFVVDATGSMGDELEYLKIEMDSIAAGVADEFPNVNQRYALIVYRDDGDLYVTRSFDFTTALDEFQTTLADQRASGGGDYPEAMHLALEEAAQLTWRDSNTARVLFLVADAPPHTEFAQRTLDAVAALRGDGIAIYPVAASGVAAEAELIMRTAALITLSQYVFLTDDSGVGNPHAEPHIPCYHVERLDQLLTRMIRIELSGERVEPQPDQIIRTVGNPVAGVCTPAPQDAEPDDSENDGANQ